MTFEDLLEGVLAFIILVAIGTFIFFSGTWYAQTNIINIRCGVIQ
jgi:hypothetical protein